MEIVNVGIIGCGAFSTYHIQELCKFSDVRITAVSSRNRANAQKQVALIRELCPPPASESVAVYTDYTEMVRHADLDAVTVCTPPPAHAEPMIAAANAGKHVFCDGPMAVDLAQCDAMIAAARSNGIRFTVQHTNRFARNAQMAKKALQDGLLGKVFMAKMELFIPGAKSVETKNLVGNWKATRKNSGGGTLFHTGRYAMDTLLWLMGDARQVYGQMATFREGMEVEDCAVGTLRFCNGALGQICLSDIAQPNLLSTPFYRIDILGSKASITVLPDWAVNAYDETYARDLNEQLSSQYSPPDGSWVNQLRDWVDAIKEQRDPLFPAESFRAQVETTRALYQSIATEMPVSLPLQPTDPYYTVAGG